MRETKPEINAALVRHQSGRSREVARRNPGFTELEVQPAKIETSELLVRPAREGMLEPRGRTHGQCLLTHGIARGSALLEQGSRGMMLEKSVVRCNGGGVVESRDELFRLP